MRLKLPNCHFAAAELPFLGHMIVRFGLKMNPAKAQKLKTTKFPINKKQVRQVLGSAGYFRDFTKDFTEITAPLTNLTMDLVSEPFKLSEQVCEYQILQFPDFNLSFILETDAS